MENIEKLETENKENSNLKIWEAPQLIMMEGGETEVGISLYTREAHSASIPLYS